MFDLIEKIACKYGCEYKEKALMSDYTSFKTGGAADLIVMPNSISSLHDIVSFCNDNSYKMYVVGNGSNIIVSDSGLSGVVIRISGAMSEVEYLGDGLVRAGAGASLSKLCTFALEHELSGLEFAFGIPGTVGGAAYMNAGAYGGEMKDVISSVNHIDYNGNIGLYLKDELDLGYRHSVYSDKQLIITDIVLSLKKSDKEKIRSAMDENLLKRKTKQPLEYPSAGSTFKRPEGNFAGALIEKCGLKGYSVGGAAVSEKHAGFVINKGNATSADILKLISYIQNTVFSKEGIHLETEVKYFE